MSRSSKGRRSACPFDFALDVFGDRWTLLIVRDLLFFGRERFAQLLEAGEGIATNILSDRLKKLESHGVVTRRPDPDNRRQVLYSLTDVGEGLAPVMAEILLWSAQYDPDTAVPPNMIKRLQEDRQGFIDDLRRKARDGADETEP